MTGNLLVVVFFAVVIILLDRLNAIMGQRIKDEGYHTWAVVIEYKSEFVRVAGSWTWLDYPQVDYITENGNLQRCRLKYASSKGPMLCIGEEVEVILHNGVLYYKPALTQSFWSRIKSMLW